MPLVFSFLPYFLRYGPILVLPIFWFLGVQNRNSFHGKLTIPFSNIIIFPYNLVLILPWKIIRFASEGLYYSWKLLRIWGIFGPIFALRQLLCYKSMKCVPRALKLHMNLNDINVSLYVSSKWHFMTEKKWFAPYFRKILLFEKKVERRH